MAFNDDFDGESVFDFEGAAPTGDDYREDNKSETLDHAMPDHLEHEPDRVRQELEEWLGGMALEDLLRELRGGEGRADAADVIDMLRMRGWLEDGSLKGVMLQGCALRDVDLVDAILSDADLDEVDLSGADLEAADLTGASLHDANLSDANLAGADLAGADLIGANFAGADMQMANLLGAQVDEAQLRRAERLWGARMPDGARYDGRFRLRGDLAAARAKGLNPDDDDALRGWYDFSADDADVEADDLS
jgi:hypothetical protein